MRLPGTTRFAVHDTDTETLTEEQPPDKKEWPSVVHCIDQGSVGSSVMHYLMHSAGYFMVVLPDPKHRVWNDIKMAAQHSRQFYWRTIVQMTLVFNLNYGPFGKGSWYEEKKTFFEQWCAQASTDDPWFLKYQARIAQDVGATCTCAEDDTALLRRVLSMQNFTNKGPLVKMMRHAGGGGGGRGARRSVGGAHVDDR